MNEVNIFENNIENVNDDEQFDIDGLFESYDRIIDGLSFDSIYLYDNMINALCSGQLNGDPLTVNKMVRLMSSMHAKALENDLREARICIDHNDAFFINWLKQAEKKLEEIVRKDQIDSSEAIRISSEIQKLYDQSRESN